MEEVQIYYLKDGVMSEEHKRKISASMKRYYSAHPMTDEHKRKISDGMKKCWVEWKEYWRKQGLI